MTAPAAPVRLSFKEQMLQAREDAIVQTVNRLLAEKGFEAMTVDEVAASVGIAKASLYKHFSSKEELAAAAVVRVLRAAQAFVQALPASAPALEQLKAVVRWAMALQLAGEMPPLPNQNSSLRQALLASRDYLEGLPALSARLRGWIEAAQADGSLAPVLPPTAVLYTLYARACDPALEFLKATGEYTEAQILDLAVAMCFDGLAARA